jgi:hypothetical protein
VSGDHTVIASTTNLLIIREQIVAEELERFGFDWLFNVFTIYKEERHDISISAPFIYAKLGLAEHLTLNAAKLANYYNKLERLYINNPYHNSRHATEVAHCLLYLITNT